MPARLVDAFNPNDKTNLAPYRLMHLIVLAFFITRFMPRDWPGLQWPAFRPLIKCGQQSLEVFCFGVFLAVSPMSCSSKSRMISGCRFWSAPSASH
jgi:hypothetical protein